MRVFIGMTEISGFYSHLALGLKELGVHADFYAWEPHPFGYSSSGVPNLVFRGIRRIHTNLRRGWRPWRLWNRAKVVASRLFLSWAAKRYDTFIFGFGTSICSPEIDLPYLRSRNKRIICVFNGSDARPAYIDGFKLHRRGVSNVRRVIEITRETKHNLQIAEQYANAVVIHDLTAHFMERPFIPLLRIGAPVGTIATSKYERPQSNGCVRVVHAPSVPGPKGSEVIRRHIETLKQRGFRIEFMELVGQPNVKVRQELNRCDFVIDQLYSDTPLAGFATEAASVGKPAVVGGYASEMTTLELTPQLIPPSHFCHPDRLEHAIEKLITDVEYRHDLGRRAKQFVDANWTRRQVAQRFLTLINGEIPQDWFYNPQDLGYLHGCGLAEGACKEMVRSVIEVGGLPALQLADKPRLEQAFANFASSSRATPEAMDP